MDLHLVSDNAILDQILIKRNAKFTDAYIIELSDSKQDSRVNNSSVPSEEVTYWVVGQYRLMSSSPCNMGFSYIFALSRLSFVITGQLARGVYCNGEPKSYIDLIYSDLVTLSGAAASVVYSLWCFYRHGQRELQGP